MSEGIATEGAKMPIKLDTEVSNGIKHAVATLDQNSSGKVEKSQLQAVVANVCQAIKADFVSDDLDNYLPESEDLSVTEFLEFLENKLLVKGKKLNPKEVDELSWVVVGQKYDEDPHMLTKKDAYKLWLVFKKLDVGGECRVDVEEICIVLEKFVRGIGVQWNEQHLTEFVEDGAFTFWKFIDCLERKFLIGVDKSVLREGLQEIFDFILDEVTKTGFLYKKGHGFLQSQKSRWFCLKPDKLTYYVSSGFREKKGDIILNNESKVTNIPDKGSNKCRFLVTCGLTKKDFEQTAPDQRTKQAWITDIQRAIDCFGGETPLKRDLIARKAKRDEDRARKTEEERKRREQEDLLDQQRREIDLLKKRKEEIEKYAEDERAALDAEIKRREELEELQRNLQQLLEDQKRAREEDEKIRAAKERLLEEERMKREQLEALRQQQQQELQNEKMQKEELMEKQKEQERILEEERKRLQHLEEERMKAEEAAKAAKDKLTAAEAAAKSAAEQAKDRVRQLKTSIGLKGTVGPKVDPLVSHRGKGAFTLEEFLNRATEWSGLPSDDEERAKALSSAPQVDELVKASATPAPNQNIPEFLKKAAAWSGLNPETYLEGAEAETKKNSSPPKVAVKPPKPLPTAAAGTAVNVEGEAVPKEVEQAAQVDTEVPNEGKQATHENAEAPKEGEQATQEDKKVPERGDQAVPEDKEVPKEGEQAAQEDKEVPKEGEQTAHKGEEIPQQRLQDDQEKIEGENKDNDRSQKEVVEGASVSNEVQKEVSDGSQVKVDEEPETTSVDKTQMNVGDSKESDLAEVEYTEGGQGVGSKEENSGNDGVSDEADGNILGLQNKESSPSNARESNAQQSTDQNYSVEDQQNLGLDDAVKEEEKEIDNERLNNQKTDLVKEETTPQEAAPSQPEDAAKDESAANNHQIDANEEGLDIKEPNVDEVEPEVTEVKPDVNGNDKAEVDATEPEVKSEGSIEKRETKESETQADENKQDAESKNGESKKPDEDCVESHENAKNMESAENEKSADADVKEATEINQNKDNIVENGEACDNTQNAAEKPNNNEDNKSELSDKCTKLDENPVAENVEGLS